MTLEKSNKFKPAFRLFPKMLKLIDENKCTNCKKEIREQDFTDELSKKEYSISGMCQTCINKIFKEDAGE